MAEIINEALDEYFPVSSGVTIIAEPGRYFVASAFTLATFVHSKREVKDAETGSVKNNMYYINDGIYGSFNSLLYDHAEVKPIPLSVSFLFHYSDLHFSSFFCIYLHILSFLF